MASAKLRRVPDVRLNPLLGGIGVWMPDGTTLLVKLVPERGAPPVAPVAPSGPIVEEGSGVTSGSSTYEARDLLRNADDADLFEYYTTSQPALVDTRSLAVTKLGPPAIYAGLSPSPDGEHFLAYWIHRPFSYQRPLDRFPLDIEVWDRAGKKQETVAKLPLAEQVPIRGERVGPRFVAWRPTAPATLFWVEALDGGDWDRKVPFRDKLMLKPVGAAAVEVGKTEHRFAGADELENGKILVDEYDRDTRWTWTWLIDPDDRAAAPRKVVDRNENDMYRDIGRPVYRVLPNAHWAVRVQDGKVFFEGEGNSPEGMRPFLDRLDLASLTSERLFRAGAGALESPTSLLDPAAGVFLTTRESASDPPNVYLRTLAGPAKAPRAGEAAFVSKSRALTHFTDPAPALRKITKKLVTYKRADGVELSFMLYLPPGYKPGTRLPTLLWAYPSEYSDPTTAGQIVAAPNQFTTAWDASPELFALAGYAVLNDTSMPIVGPVETVYDTFIEQITADSKAAIDEAVRLGVTDPDRVAVSGHSHGALMTANLLAWTDLFRAGIARSGAYNHTLRPFGFQNEHRTLYQATATYLKLSPLLHADQIDEPLLLIHGQLDANPGTVPLQSEKLYEAVRGVGGTVRLVILPFESHGYAALESNEHVAWEMLTWMDKYVKNAPPRAKKPAPTGHSR